MTKLDNFRDLGNVLEPFDPDYLNDKPYEVPDISSYEKRFLRKVSIIENKLRRNRIDFEWLPNWECFRVCREEKSGYLSYRYVRVNMDENDYSFGTETRDLVYDGKASVVIDAVVAWVNAQLVKKVSFLVQPKKYHRGYCLTVCDSLKEAKEQKAYWERNTDFEWVIVER